MSHITFESLPNEILTDLFEKYINGVDIINAFAFQLNHRIDLLIRRCQRFRFDFVECSKDAFRMSMGLLPAYADRIEDLALSDGKTPGQIYAFLHLYPSFEQFRNLRRLFFDAVVTETMMESITHTLNTLSGTKVDTLTLRIKDDLSLRDENGYWARRNKRYRLQTRIKKLSLSVELEQTIIYPLMSLEHLTLTNLCEENQLDSILQTAPVLKYLDIKIRVRPARYAQFARQTPKFPALPLRTLIIKIKQEKSDEWNSLQPYLEQMPHLQRLEVTGGQGFCDADTWKTIIIGSLKLLKHFRLTIDSSMITLDKVLCILDQFQTPFWITMKDFQFIMTNQNSMDRYSNTTRGRSKIPQQYWTRPIRKNVSSMTENPIQELIITETCQFLSPDQQFTHLHTLVIHHLDNDLIQAMIECLSASRIRHLTITHFKGQHKHVASVLSLFSNLETLIIPLPIIFPSNDHHPVRNENLRSLDISETKHSFDEHVINSIHYSFPNIQHLSLNTNDLHNVPMCETFFTRLSSLEFEILHRRGSRMYDADDGTEFEFKKWAYEFWHRTKLSYRIDRKKMIVWLGEGDLNNEHWMDLYGDRLDVDTLQADSRVVLQQLEHLDRD